jgi:hypothetical protein
MSLRKTRGWALAVTTTTAFVGRATRSIDSRDGFATGLSQLSRSAVSMRLPALRAGN